MVHFVDNVEKIFNIWNIRAAVMFSLLLQILLIIIAPFRKRTSHKFVILVIWSSYLLADATANFAVGLISNSQGASPNDSKQDASSKKADENNALLAFWAPFLLVHLGGPDTITAFALEDNELWLRHLLAFIAQLSATGYVFFRTLTSNQLMVPTLLLFLSGIIKYLERTCSLNLASMDRFRDSQLEEPDPGPNYAKLMQDYTSKKIAQLPTKIIMIPDTGEANSHSDKPESPDLSDQLKIVRKAYQLFQVFRGLIVDLIFTFKKRNETRDFFTRISAEDALRVIEAELSFMYEALFTKVVVVQSKWGYPFRFLSFGSVVTAFCLFYFDVKKHKFNGFNVGVTYALLVGAIALDGVAFLMAYFSDWRAAQLTEPSAPVPGNYWSYVTSFFSDSEITILTELLNIKKIKWQTFTSGTEPKFSINIMDTSIFFRRWSGYISGHNLIRYCLEESPSTVCNIKKSTWYGCITKKVKPVIRNGAKKFFQFKCIDKFVEFIGLKDFIEEILYASKEPFTKEFWEFIFNQLRDKSLFAEDPETAKMICATRGAWVFLHNDSYENLKPYVSSLPYDQCLLTWHVATDLLYNAEADHTNSYSYREYSKILSNYMVYLLIMQPSTMQAVAGIGKIIFRDTCAETERFFREHPLICQEKHACQEIRKVKTHVQPIAVKGDKSKSVLFDASMLATELEKLQDKKWEIISKVWVELLSYAASNSRATALVQQVSKGGELITLVWLLMAHFGLGDQFQVDDGHARAKLIVGK